MGSVRVGRNAYVHFTLSFLILEEGSKVAKNGPFLARTAVQRLINIHRSAARERNGNEDPPTCVLDLTARYFSTFHVFDKRFNVVAKEVEFMIWNLSICCMD